MTLWIWLGFLAFILLMLGLDLGVFHRQAHQIKTREALSWSLIWVSLALAFNWVLFHMYSHHWLGIGIHFGHKLAGHDAALQFFTGYIIEKSLSLDNIFVIALIFSYFRVPLQYQHRVLFWGILGALVMRGIMIAAGAILITRFSWMVYVFGTLLIFTAIKMLVDRHDNLEPQRNPLIKLARRFLPVTKTFHRDHFFIKFNHRRAMTPLFLVLLVIESSDVMFAIDSIPAIFAVTKDPFIVFTSNIFAILGLRSLFFVLASVMEKFRYLKISLVFVLAYVGVKMLLSHYYPIPVMFSLATIGGILLVGMLASIYAQRRPAKIPPKSAQLQDAPHRQRPVVGSGAGSK